MFDVVLVVVGYALLAAYCFVWSTTKIAKKSHFRLFSPNEPNKSNAATKNSNIIVVSNGIYSLQNDTTKELHKNSRKYMINHAIFHENKPNHGTKERKKKAKRN